MIHNNERGIPPDGPNLLGALGFGPETLLMNDPKLFVDERFLASLLSELEGELGIEGAQTALFQIGLAHGFRDARRLEWSGAMLESTDLPASACSTTTLIMQMSVPSALQGNNLLEMNGSWPDGHEAGARLSKLGRCDSPSCYLSAGYTSGWLSGTHDIDIIVQETACAAAGAERCTFHAIAVENWSTRPLEHVHIHSYERFRQMPDPREAELHELSLPAPAIDPSGMGSATQAGSFDPLDDAVHIWGPVMVLPFTNIDEALGTVDMLGRDPGVCSVRVVIVDLRMQPLDDDFGAAALEQILEAIESWGAEAILTGVSPFAEAVVCDLEAKHLLTRKDLPEAIAVAFQIAEAQRHLL